ncbi:MAG: hypothetical protein HYT61_01620 [Candidatus Yanofskybacteria bacterium]|nr:hypothetical protein [Candidatus Yanofskybacteria bacterium]
MEKEKDFKPKGAIWLFIILVLTGFAWAVLYFSRKNPDLANNSQVFVSRLTNTRQPRTYTVFYGLGVFSPTNIRIHVGDSVRFQNDSNIAMRVISDSANNVLDLAGLDSVGGIPPDGVFTYTFGQAGIFGYHNFKNQSEEGTVIVRP